MREYLLSVHHSAEGPGLTDEEMQQSFADVGAFNREIRASDNWVFAGGLYPPDTATVVNNKDGQVVTTDGPYAETKEQLGGFWIIAAEDLDSALAIAGRASKACWMPVEVRPFMPNDEE